MTDDDKAAWEKYRKNLAHETDYAKTDFQAGRDSKPDAEWVKLSSARLVWQEPSHANNYCHVSNTPIGDYYVNVDGGFHLAWFEPDGSGLEIGEGSGDLLTEQFKCEAHYQNIAREMFGKPPQPDLQEET